MSFEAASTSIKDYPGDSVEKVEVGRYYEDRTVD